VSGTARLALVAAGAILAALGVFLDPSALLAAAGFPSRELTNPWVLADLAVVRGTSTLLGGLIVVSQLALWRFPDALTRVAARARALGEAPLERPLVVPIALLAMVFATVVLQLVLYLLGYTAFSADDFGRPLSAAFWLRYRKFDLGMDGWLGLAGSGWLPFSDYVFAAGLALHRDLFITPRLVNLLVSSLAVVSAYGLGRELFGRTVGLATAFLFTFQPWHVWLGMSGMSSDLPSVALIPLFGMFLIRWLRTDAPRALVAAAAMLALASGFRYENWLFCIVLSGLVVATGVERWRQGRLSRAWVVPAVWALVIANGFPVLWMASSYVVFGDWLPAMHGINAFMVAFMASETARTETSMGIPLMAAGSFPFEIALSIAGVALLPRSQRSGAVWRYLAVVAGTAVLFTVVFRGQLAAWLHISRYLLGFVVLALPFAGRLVVELFRAPDRWRREGLVAACVILVTVCVFDVRRSLNYPASFPRDAIDTGWMLRGLQKAGTVPGDAKILVERSGDFGDLSIVALANTPERFVVLNELAYRRMALSGMLANRPALIPAAVDEGVRGAVCDNDFQVAACRGSVLAEDFRLVILSTPERVRSFAETFRVRSWNIGRYHMFDMSAPLVSAPDDAGLASAPAQDGDPGAKR
jgi:hypothetical protein